MFRKYAVGLVLVLLGGQGLFLWWQSESEVRLQSLREEARLRAPDEGLIRGPSRPGVERPPARSAAAVAIADDEEVLGVVAGGKSRAYLLSALNEKEGHVVNDVVGGVPVSATYCGITHCARAFEGEPGGGPLALQQGGVYRGRGMLLQVGPTPYFQDTGQPAFSSDCPPPFPYRPHLVERTTWGSWKRRHPETEIVVDAAAR